MTLEEKKKIFYNIYKKLSKRWSYKCDVFIFDTPKYFSNLFSGDEMTFDKRTFDEYMKDCMKNRI